MSVRLSVDSFRNKYTVSNCHATFKKYLTFVEKIPVDFGEFLSSLYMKLLLIVITLFIQSRRNSMAKICFDLLISGKSLSRIGLDLDIIAIYIYSS